MLLSGSLHTGDSLLNRRSGTGCQHSIHTVILHYKGKNSGVLTLTTIAYRGDDILFQRRSFLHKPIGLVGFCIGRRYGQNMNLTQVLSTPCLVGVFKNIGLFQIRIFVISHPLCVVQQARFGVVIITVLNNALLHGKISAQRL